MTEHEQFPISREDAALDKHLLALQRFKPKNGFEDRVMARVRVRSAEVSRFQEKTRALATPRRLWWGSGLAAAGATGWTVALTSWLAGSQRELVGAWLTMQVGEPLRAGVLQATNYAIQMLGFYAQAAHSLIGNAVFALVPASMLLTVLSSWGLYQTMKQPRDKRIAAYAAR